MLTAVPPVWAQAPEDVRSAFLQWAKKSLHPVSYADLDASTKDLRPIERMIADATIVGLSEGPHAAAEPLIFRNRLFKHLVEHLGFNAIALESGICRESGAERLRHAGERRLRRSPPRRLLQWIRHVPPKWGLIHWMREYNARLAPGAVKVQIFGLDVPGSPGNFDAARGPDTASSIRTGIPPRSRPPSSGGNAVPI